MEIGLDAIGHALSDNRLSVPIYQRSYAWTDGHVTDLLQDLATAIDEGETEYFLGSIVATASADSHRQEIVDGQQRLATTSILLSAIRDYFHAHGDADRASDIEREYLSVRDIRTARSPQPRIRIVVSPVLRSYRPPTLRSLRRSATSRRSASSRFSTT
jgi:uncharacterized protein with ParB-like and HNH nuclease domain